MPPNCDLRFCFSFDIVVCLSLSVLLMILINEPRSEKTGLDDIFEFLCNKHLKNTKN